MVKQIFFVRETRDTTKQRGKRRSTEPRKGEESSKMIGGRKAFFSPCDSILSGSRHRKGGNRAARQCTRAEIQFGILSWVSRWKAQFYLELWLVNLLSKYPQTRRQRGDRANDRARLELPWLGKSGLFDLVGTKGSRDEEKEKGRGWGGRNQEGRRKKMVRTIGK